jgi:hypothetical protein
MKKVIIEIDKNCIGCLSLTRVPDYYKAECKFTDGGITSIPLCACKECLIKMICQTPCENFLTIAKSYRRTNEFLLTCFSDKKVIDKLMVELSKD